MEHVNAVVDALMVHAADKPGSGALDPKAGHLAACLWGPVAMLTHFLKNHLSARQITCSTTCLHAILALGGYVNPKLPLVPAS